MNRLALIAVTVAFACATRDENDAPDWTTTRSTAGDTTVVRTTGGSAASGARELVPELSIGSVDATAPEYSIGAIADMDVGPNGDIYAFDRLPPALRVYDSTGRFVRTLGAKGQGPGEYERANGLAVHRDGRVALWDGSTARINIYASTGEFLAGWPVPGGTGSFTSRGMFVDTAGFTYARARVGDPPPDGGPGGVSGPTRGLLKWTPDGTLADSLMPPVAPLEGGRLTASSKGAVIVIGAPFAPDTPWTWSPLGYMVSANTATYAVTLHRPAGGPLRIERDVLPVTVQDEERANYEEVAIGSLRQIDPTWRWSGPSIPTTKPLLQTVRVARDGRVWVMVSQPGERIPEAELPPIPPRQSFEAPNAPPRAQTRWRDPVVYDVYEPDGEFLGRVAIPRRTTVFTMRGNHVWGVMRDSLDVEQLTRFRVTPGFSSPAPAR